MAMFFIAQFLCILCTVIAVSGKPFGLQDFPTQTQQKASVDYFDGNVEESGGREDKKSGKVLTFNYEPKDPEKNDHLGSHGQGAAVPSQYPKDKGIGPIDIPNKNGPDLGYEPLVPNKKNDIDFSLIPNLNKKDTDIGTEVKDQIPNGGEQEFVIKDDKYDGPGQKDPTEGGHGSGWGREDHGKKDPADGGHRGTGFFGNLGAILTGLKEKVGRKASEAHDHFTRFFKNVKEEAVRGSSLFAKLERRLLEGEEVVEKFFYKLGKQITEWRKQHGYSVPDKGFVTQGKEVEEMLDNPEFTQLFEQKELREDLEKMVDLGILQQKEVDDFTQVVQQRDKKLIQQSSRLSLNGDQDTYLGKKENTYIRPEEGPKTRNPMGEDSPSETKIFKESIRQEFESPRSAVSQRLTADHSSDKVLDWINFIDKLVTA